MIIVIPYSHEDMTVRRWPVHTFIILILCFLVFIVTRSDTNSMQRKLNNTAREFFTYYSQHPYLDVPENFYQEFPGFRRVIENLQASQFLQYYSEESTPEMRELHQENLNTIIKSMIDARSSSIVYRHGYRPIDGINIRKMISYGFIHYGFIHFLSNMFLFWLMAPIIEDKLGRIYFPVFYVFSIIFAAFTHMVFSTGMMLSTPMIGASGGIAGLMGAFLIRMAKTKIKLFYFTFWFFRAGTFELPAYTVLPFWFLVQLVQGLIQRQAPVSNVAFWAHVGGFVFGFAVFLFLRVSKVEENIEQKLDKEEPLFDEDLLKALEFIDSEQTDEALPILLRLKNTSEEPVVWTELSKLYLMQKNREKAYENANTGINLLIKKGLHDMVLNFYTDLKNIDRDFLPAPKHTLNIANMLKKIATNESLEEAKELYKRLFRLEKYSPIAVKSIIGYADILSRYENNTTEAKSFLNKALKHFTNHPEAMEEIEKFSQTLKSD